MKKILVIEDDAWQAEHYERELTRSGYQVGTARHGYDAMEKINQQIPDAIVLDMLLPGSNGVTLLHELRSHDDLMHIPVVVVSSLALPERSMARYGVRQVLDKTTATNVDLVLALKRVLA